ncbi:uncharacterized protein LOC108676932 [Hyalella azteca]|uniref:Uncharacterized protein LOC108676932 n=1 Tax=Hyalella azteca TaxID=294128 RepID=A0A979FVS7_HYAAZ|nr:uncharacterized protein LOC108676932 [Hyalella azteca]
MIIPGLYQTNTFGIVNITKTIKDSTADFFGVNLFSVETASADVKEAIEKYDEVADHESNATNLHINETIHAGLVRNNIANTVQEAKMDPEDLKLVQSSIEKVTEKAQNETETFKHTGVRYYVPSWPAREKTNSIENITSREDKSGNKINDLNEKDDSESSSVMSSIIDNLKRRLVSSIHQNIITLLHRTLFPTSRNAADEKSSNDVVSIALDFLGVEDEEFGSRCREKLVCDARKLAASLPYVSAWFRCVTSGQSAVRLRVVQVRH